MTKILYNTPRISTKYEYLHDIRDCAMWLWERCLNGNTNYWWLHGKYVWSTFRAKHLTLFFYALNWAITNYKGDISQIYTIFIEEIFETKYWKIVITLKFITKCIMHIKKATPNWKKPPYKCPLLKC